MPSNNVSYIRDFVRKYDKYFHDAFQVVIERQMRCNMRIVESVIHALFFERTIVVSARSVKLHYDLSTKNYRMNKQKAVEWAVEFVARNPQAFAENLLTRSFEVAKKQDEDAKRSSKAPKPADERELIEKTGMGWVEQVILCAAMALGIVLSAQELGHEGDALDSAKFKQMIKAARPWYDPPVSDFKALQLRMRKLVR